MSETPPPRVLPFRRPPRPKPEPPTGALQITVTVVKPEPK